MEAPYASLCVIFYADSNRVLMDMMPTLDVEHIQASNLLQTVRTIANICLELQKGRFPKYTLSII